MKLGPAKSRRLDQPITVSLEDLVPRDHFSRSLEAKLDLSFVREWARERYAERGRPSIDPVVFFKLQLVMFCEGIRSERQLLRVVAHCLSMRWSLGYDLTEPLPDHSSLSRIRDHYGLEGFRRFFAASQNVKRILAHLGWGRRPFPSGAAGIVLPALPPVPVIVL